MENHVIAADTFNDTTIVSLIRTPRTKITLVSCQFDWRNSVVPKPRAFTSEEESRANHLNLTNLIARADVAHLQ
jgi:hypothetical protein